METGWMDRGMYEVDFVACQQYSSAANTLVLPFLRVSTRRLSRGGTALGYLGACVCLPSYLTVVIERESGLEAIVAILFCWVGVSRFHGEAWRIASCL